MTNSRCVSHQRKARRNRFDRLDQATILLARHRGSLGLTACIAAWRFIPQAYPSHKPDQAPLQANAGSRQITVCSTI
jgi:hypothetical protein